ncbi:hypothetical protein BT63DRAFT_452911 [Microthyrium microscopicum]|uniref:Uncharacterized protein n=1 Tax=Microthyrium microscopicum TaxID=703497 RepID=A0A6A6UJF2_9PEZI|nr:hypothetical protein BT63DRAFT_452911 [Microthyrium microscopicum]
MQFQSVILAFLASVAFAAEQAPASAASVAAPAAEATAAAEVRYSRARVPYVTLSNGTKTITTPITLDGYHSTGSQPCAMDPTECKGVLGLTTKKLDGLILNLLTNFKADRPYRGEYRGDRYNNGYRDYNHNGRNDRFEHRDGYRGNGYNGYRDYNHNGRNDRYENRPYYNNGKFLFEETLERN